jgi:hypothetical protein
MALSPAAKDIPAQTGSYGQSLRRTKSIFSEAGVISIRFSREKILAEVRIIA